MTRTLPQSPRPAPRLRRAQRQAQASGVQRLRWRLEAGAVQLLLGLLRGRRHGTVQRAIQRAVGLGRPLLAGRLATAEANLERVYGPALPPAARQRLARRSLENFFLSCLESIIEPVAPQRIRVEGDGLAALLGRRPGQGVIIGSLHLGCWDLGLRWLSEQLDDLAVIYRPAHNPEADRLLNAARSANSRCRWISQFDRRAMLTCLHRGGALVVMTDLYGGRNALLLDVLGLDTQVAAGPVNLSQRTGTALFPVAHVREPDGSFRLICGTPLQPQPGAAGLQQQAQALCDWQEPWIQAYAAQYYWIHRRWRPGDGSGRRRRQLPPPRLH
ncbi:MAG: lysophospholipid acyltransferase family protein [Chitinophagaceae bacterium]|nr:lysophospholipid acyltransferase family protein [Chitinophagaceae bacterium]